MRSDIRRGWSTLWLAGCLLVASVFVWQGLPSSAQSSSGIASKGIETLRVGDRVFIAEETHVGRDLSLGEEIDPSSWRKLTLRLRKTDGELMDVVLLRPEEWVEEAVAKVGATIPLNLEEIGISGPATVDRIEPCPFIRPGTGRPITGTFSHELSNVIELRVKGADEPLRVTTSHKMYSVSRKDFVPAGELKEGEELLDRNGPVQIASIAPYPGKYRVYNLEVFVDHVYHVTNAGLLAHNACGDFSPLAPGGGLMAHENAGGHLLNRHLGKSDTDLASRLASEPWMKTASTFNSRAEAESAVAHAFNFEATKVQTWVNSGANGRLVINAPFNGGSVLQRGASSSNSGNGVRVVLQGNQAGGYRIVTGFPTP